MKRKFLTALLSFALVFSLALSLAVTAGQAAAPAEPETQTVNFTNAAPLVEPPSLPNPANADGAAAAEDKPFNLAKNVTQADGTYKVSLEAFATGTIASGEALPADIVLVLDQSGSMVRAENVLDLMKIYDSLDDPLDKSKNYYVNGSPKPIKLEYKNNSWVEVNNQGVSHSPKTSADDDAHEQFYTMRFDAMVKAVSIFAEEVKTSAVANNINHRIAIVGFGSGSTGYQDTELYIGSSRYNYKKPEKSDPTGTIASEHYDTAFQDMSTDGGRNNITASINALHSERASTFSNLGLKMAKGILDAYPLNEEQRNRVVVFFTDGAPGSSSTYPYWSDPAEGSYKTANDAIAEAKSIKESGATVYSVGIFTGAAAGSPPPLPEFYPEDFNDVEGSHNQYHSHAISNVNRYMHLVSSNYPDAESMTVTGSVNPNIPDDTGYYLSAADAEALTDIFESISGEITQISTSAGEEAVTLDKLSQYFQLPAGTNPADIDVYTADAKAGAHGNPEDDDNWEPQEEFSTAEVKVNAATGEVKVSGFDFSKNFVSEDTHSDPFNGSNTNFYGRKLIIEFNIEPKPGFLGGNNVPTNDEASGIYADEGAADPLQPFDVPKTNVEILEITVTAQDKNVYLYGALTEEQLKAGAAAAAGTGNNAITIKLDESNYGLESWQYEFVNIAVNVTEESYTDLTEDTDYTVDVKITPKDTTGTATEKSASATGKINVFKPELTFKDSDVCYGGKAPADYSANLVKTEWKHGETLDTAAVPPMIGDKPTLALTYTPEADCIKAVNNVDYIVTRDDIPVKVTVKIDAADATAHVKFIHQACTNETGCGWDNLNPTPTNGDPAFLLHVKTCTLTVEKTIKDGKTYQPGESFIFRVTGDNPALPIEMEVVAHVGENGTVQSITINGLPVGTYTVTEDTGWSWRYEVTGGNGVAVELKCGSTPAARTGTANFTNNLVSDKWLTWEAAVDNRWNSTGGIDKAILPKPEPEPANP